MENASEKKEKASEFERICTGALTFKFGSKTPTHEMLTQIAKIQAITSAQLSSLQVGGRRVVGRVAGRVSGWLRAWQLGVGGWGGAAGGRMK